MLGFSGEAPQKRKIVWKKKQHPEPQTAGCSFYLEDGTWKTGVPKKTGFRLHVFLLVSFSTEPWSMEDTWARSSQDWYMWLKKTMASKSP